MKVLTVNVQWTTRSRCDRINAGPVCLNGSHGSHDTQKEEKDAAGTPVSSSSWRWRHPTVLFVDRWAYAFVRTATRQHNLRCCSSLCVLFALWRYPAELVRCVDKGWKVDGWILDTELELDHPRAVHGCLFISGKNFRFHWSLSSFFCH